MKRMFTIFFLIAGINTQAQLKKLFQREVLYQHFSGVAYVESRDSVLNYSHGMRDKKESINFSTTFDVGSITKQFTAAAILHLAMDGKFSLHDPINPLLGKNSSDRWNKVTVHQLLTHTSGIPSLYQTEQGLDVFFPETNPITLESLIAKFRDGKLLFSPGEEFSYSNSGYILLAAIIEHASKQSYFKYMTTMFKKYGLSSTTFEPGMNSAIPYYGYRNDLVKEAPVNHSSWFIGAGGTYSSVSDLSRWVDIIQSDTFLTRELRKSLLKTHTNNGYGYGWVHSDEMIHHDGGNAGFMSHLSFNAETHEKVIILTNRSFEDIKAYGKSAEYIRGLVDRCWSAMRGETVEVLPKIEDLNVPTKLFFENGISMKRSDTVLLVSKEGSSISRIIPNTQLDGKTKLEERMIEITENLSMKKYWSLAKYCDGEMKFVMYSGIMSIGMRMMKKQTGGADHFIPYFVNEDHGIIRMKGPEGNLDLIIYFNEEGLVQGIFEHGFFRPDQEVMMIAYPIGNSLYHLDGLPYGEKSATLKITDSSFIVYQLNRSVAFESR